MKALQQYWDVPVGNAANAYPRQRRQSVHPRKCDVLGPRLLQVAFVNDTHVQSQ